MSLMAESFLDTLSRSLDQMFDIYEHVIVIGDTNINSMNKSTPKLKHLNDFCDSHDLSNLMKE